MKTLEMKEMEAIEGGKLCDLWDTLGCAVMVSNDNPGMSIEDALTICVFTCYYS
jgi:bacteriocin-like protein